MPTQNLGFVKAIHVGTVAPTNTAQIWYDSNVNQHKVYNTGTAAWEALATSIASYTTIEHSTGVQWIDSKIIYRQVFTFSPVPATRFQTAMFTSTGVISDVISIKCFLTANSVPGAVTWFDAASLNTDLGLTYANSMAVQEGGGNTDIIVEWAGTSFNTQYQEGMVIVEYTKI